MTPEREVCLCQHDKATHHAEQRVIPTGDGSGIMTVYGHCLARWCLCAIYMNETMTTPGKRHA